MKKTVLVTGASGEIGKEIAKAFAKEGYKVAIHYNSNEKAANELKTLLLNNGAEEHKGSTMYKETHQLLKNMDINFIGNVEGRDIFNSVADVVVADGFAGNILLKTTEGTAGFFSKKLKEMFTESILTKLCALILKKGIKKMKSSFDYTEHGGAPILGAKKVVIKAN